MDLFGKLSSLGSGAASAAPTSMSQIQVQPMAMDLSSTIPAANAQVSYQGAADAVANKGMDWGAIGKGALKGVATYLGSQGQQQGGGVAPQGLMARGGSPAEEWNAEKLSGLRMANQQRWAQAPGLMKKG